MLAAVLAAVFRVEAWQFSLERPAEPLGALCETLSPDERARAARFVHGIHRDRYVVGRATLRRRLARLTGRDPRDIAFDYGPQGKPALADGPEFNLSHSGARAVLAVSGDGPLGVDIEQHAPVEDGVAQRFFSPREYAALSGLAPEAWRAGFYRCWTRKEAVIKALGQGLSMPLDSFDVTLGPEEPAVVIRIDGDRPGDWRLAHFDPAPGWSGAVAAQTCGRDLALTWRHDAP